MSSTAALSALLYERKTVWRASSMVSHHWAGSRRTKNVVKLLTVAAQRVPTNDRGPSVGQPCLRTGTTLLTAHARALSVIDRVPPAPSSAGASVVRGPSPHESLLGFDFGDHRRIRLPGRFG